MSALYTALSKAHSKLLLAPMDSVNPAFRSKYASLESILKALKPVLAENDLFVSQFPIGTNTLRTVVGHKSGEKIVSSFSMTPQTEKPHAIGSNITYMRRYALLSIFAMVGDPDDDGNEASASPAVVAVSPIEQIKQAAVKNGWTGTDVLKLVTQELKKSSLESCSPEDLARVLKCVSNYKPNTILK